MTHGRNTVSREGPFVNARQTMFRTRSLLAQLLTPLLLAFSAMGETAGGAPSTKAADHPTDAAGPRNFWVYVGTYTSPTNGSKGIYLLDMDTQSGELTPKGLVAEVKSPSFLAVHPNRRFLYAVGEIFEFQGKKAGAVSAFAIDPPTGKLTLLNQQPSGGQGPCHVIVEPTGKCALTANYTTGTVAVLPIDNQGRLSEPSAVAQHQGSGPNARRQQSPHAHSINLDPAGRFAFAPDLGADKVFVYRFHPRDGSLVPNDLPAAPVTPGSGPRHFAFHPGGRFAYVINELTSTITAFSYGAERGILKELQTVSTLPGGFTGESFTADIHVHPNGRFLYGSNRGHDSIAIFAIDDRTGRLSPTGHEPTRGKKPRNFAVDPSGTWLLAANQDSNTVVVFRIDPKTGLLTTTGNILDVPSPVCLRLVPRSP
jgi:6-phosphogluconolactonase